MEIKLGSKKEDNETLFFIAMMYRTKTWTLKKVGKRQFDLSEIWVWCRIILITFKQLLQ